MWQQNCCVSADDYTVMVSLCVFFSSLFRDLSCILLRGLSPHESVPEWDYMGSLDGGSLVSYYVGETRNRHRIMSGNW
jgi:hypothetical protein